MTLVTDNDLFEGGLPYGLDSDYVSITSVEDGNGVGIELRIYMTAEMDVIHIGESVYAGKAPPIVEDSNIRMYFSFSAPEDVQEFCSELMRLCDLTWPSEKL